MGGWAGGARGRKEELERERERELELELELFIWQAIGPFFTYSNWFMIIIIFINMYIHLRLATVLLQLQTANTFMYICSKRCSTLIISDKNNGFFVMLLISEALLNGYGHSTTNQEITSLPPKNRENY